MATPAPFARRRLGRRLSAVSVAVMGTLALAVAGALGVAAAPTLHGSSSGTHATLTAAETAAPTVTALCSSTSGKYAWQVSTTQTLSNYNIDYSVADAPPWTEVRSTVKTFTVDTASSYSKLYPRWDSDQSEVGGAVTADATACPTPTPVPTPTPTATAKPTATATAKPVRSPHGFALDLHSQGDDLDAEFIRA